MTMPSRQANDIPIDIENNVEGLDWESIAEKVRHLTSLLSPVDIISKVSLASNINRTAEQCRIKWLGDRHPRTNHRGWSASELEHLKRLVTEQQGANNGKVDWVYVAKMLGVLYRPSSFYPDAHPFSDKPDSDRLHASRNTATAAYMEYGSRR